MRDAYQLLFYETVITIDDQIGEGEIGSGLGGEHITWQLTRFQVQPNCEATKSLCGDPILDKRVNYLQSFAKSLQNVTLLAKYSVHSYDLANIGQF